MIRVTSTVLFVCLCCAKREKNGVRQEGVWVRVSGRRGTCEAVAVWPDSSHNTRERDIYILHFFFLVLSGK